VAHSLSAKKRVRQNAKRNARNRARKEMLKTQVKAFTAALTAHDPAKAETELKLVTSRLDRLAAKNTIHKNAAARKRSRLTKRLNAVKAAGPAPVKTTGGKAAKAKA
jgi:small subunit ribosomal protein S20